MDVGEEAIEGGMKEHVVGKEAAQLPDCDHGAASWGGGVEGQLGGTVGQLTHCHSSKT